MTPDISPRNVFLLLPLMFLPIVTYLGSMLNIGHNNSVLLIAVLLICILPFAILLLGNAFPEKLYPLAILTISFCLIFQVLWMSPYIMGYDVHTEFFLFESVKMKGYWNPNYSELYESALSVTILPAMVQGVLVADDTAIFKTMYPLALSIVPVVMYLAYKHVVDSKRAFLSAVFLMSYSIFFQGVSFIGKQEIAQLILALLILLIFMGKSRGYGQPLTILVLIAGLVVSHYSSAYIVVSLLLLSWIILVALGRKSKITLPFLGLGAVMAFAWGIYTATGTAFDTLVQLGVNVYGGIISDFFRPETRGGMLMKALGVGVTPGLVNRIDLLVYYLIQLFIVVGVVRLWKQRRTVNGEFLSFACVGVVLVVVSILLPYFAGGINMERIYQIALIFLSPSCVLGGETVFSTLFHALSILNRNHWHPRFRFTSVTDSHLTLVASIIILFLLFNTGFIHEATGTPPISISLGLNRISGSNDQRLLSFLYGTYIPEQDHRSAEWLSKYMVHNQNVCGDRESRLHVLLSYARIPLKEDGEDYVRILYPGSTRGCVYVYLSHENVMLGFGWGWDNPYPMSEVSPVLEYRNMVYSNGGSDILA